MPSAKAAIAKRANKIMNNALEGAWDEKEAQTMKRMENFIEKKLEECQISPQLLAAALLKMNMGEDIYGITEEITLQSFRKRNRENGA